MRSTDMLVGVESGGWTFISLDLGGRGRVDPFLRIFAGLVERGRMPLTCVVVRSTTDAGEMLVSIPPTTMVVERCIEALIEACGRELNLRLNRKEMPQAGIVNAGVVTTIAATMARQRRDR
jgi:hypothetical protein